MTGEELKSLIKSAGYKISDLSQLMGISEQALNSKLNAQDVKVSLLKAIAQVSNKTVYYWMGLAEKQKSDFSENTYKDKYLACMEQCNALQSQIILLKEEKKRASSKHARNA